MSGYLITTRSRLTAAELRVGRTYERNKRIVRVDSLRRAGGMIDVAYVSITGPIKGRRHQRVCTPDERFGFAICPTPGKVRYATPELAQDRAMTLTAIHGQARAYRCECGYWHLSSKP